MNNTEFTNTVESYKDDIFRIALSYLKDVASAEDVVQETFLKLYTSTTVYESEAHKKNWLIKVAINDCKKKSLSLWAKKTVPLENYMETVPLEQDEKDLLQYVLSLPKRYRIVIHLFYYEGYKTKEIASLLNISETSVQTQLARGREKLKDILTVAMEEGEYDGR